MIPFKILTALIDGIIIIAEQSESEIEAESGRKWTGRGKERNQWAETSLFVRLTVIMAARKTHRPIDRQPRLNYLNLPSRVNLLWIWISA